MFFTLGYEGLSLDTFIDILHANKIECLVDVRQNPFSRKAGFSKSSLATRIESEQIQYRHIAALGCPRAVRDQYKADNDWSRYTRDFSSYIESQDEVLQTLLQEEQRSCLMCFEANGLFCHRSLITKRLRQLAGTTEVVHLTAASIVPHRVLV